ncbi:hypothetical protein [Dictyobacter kobayashii]|uniref:Uncharacterized protein n=1 Tax=Dictyobacter kobayashii TaxID=2014872 RepID=A0A402AVA3_9CHLR|nr:hypothetical protein [Dictyobacter kobayashii]GCE23070.1 hypothetical protein KDK_68700 [Dictyobacter kobayashii]
MKKRALSVLVLSMLMLAFLAAVPLNASAATPSAASQLAKHHKVHFFMRGNKHKDLGARQFAGGNNLNYGGGPVMGGTTNVFAIFWEPTGNVSSTYQGLIQRYFGDVNGSGLYNNNTQYTDSAGNVPSNTQFAGSWTDNTAYPESPLLDSDIQNEVSRAQSANGWSSSIDNIFFVFTEAGQDLCFDSSQSQCASNAFCAYHSYFGSNTIYAAMPYAASFSCNGGQGPNGDQAADETINVTSHEQMEAATDPLLNAWTDSSGQEIGDKCAWNFGSVNSDGSNVNFNGDPYLLQQEWDNNIGGCTLTGP